MSRACEACGGSGPCLWADSGGNAQRYLCRGCHPNPDDVFFTKISKGDGGIHVATCHCGQPGVASCPCCANRVCVKHLEEASRALAHAVGLTNIAKASALPPEFPIDPPHDPLHRRTVPGEELPPPSDVPEAAGLPFDAPDAGFECWWLAFYGAVDCYADVDEYWTRKAFAWWGWKAPHSTAPAPGVGDAQAIDIRALTNEVLQEFPGDGGHDDESLP